MSGDYCEKHPKVRKQCPACLGAEGGRRKSPAKTEAARKNASKGGRASKRPRIYKPCPTHSDTFHRWTITAVGGGRRCTCGTRRKVRRQ